MTPQTTSFSAVDSIEDQDLGLGNSQPKAKAKAVTEKESTGNSVQENNLAEKAAEKAPGKLKIAPH